MFARLLLWQLTRIPRRDLSPSPVRGPDDSDHHDPAISDGDNDGVAHVDAAPEGEAQAKSSHEERPVVVEAVRVLLPTGPPRRPPVVVRDTCPLGPPLASITSQYGRDKVKDIVDNAYLVWVRNGTVRAVGANGCKRKYVYRTATTHAQIDSCPACRAPSM